MHFQQPRQVVLGLQSEPGIQMRELCSRLENNQFTEQPATSSRRLDGEIILHPDSSERRVVIRMNAYQRGEFATVSLQQSAESFTFSELLVRPSSMTGDDRSLFVIPQAVQEIDRPLAENLIYAACLCVARGTVAPAAAGVGGEKTFSLYLPRARPAARFDPEYSVLGLPGLY